MHLSGYRSTTISCLLIEIFGEGDILHRTVLIINPILRVASNLANHMRPPNRDAAGG